MSKQRIVMVAVVAVLTAVVSNSAFAQRGGFGRGGGGLMGLLRIEAVQKEIEALDDQIAAVEKLSEKLSEEFPRPDFQNFRDMSDADREKAMTQFRERSEKMAKAAEAKLQEIFLPPQIERLKEIVVQQMGVSALQNDEVVTALKLTDAQKQKIEEAMTAMRDAPRPQIDFRNASQEEREKAFAEMREQRTKAEEKVFAILTATQKSQFEKMKGEAFEMPRPDFGGRGGQGRGGQGRGGQGGGNRPQ